jgi:hypothetical protein
MWRAATAPPLLFYTSSTLGRPTADPHGFDGTICRLHGYPASET